MSTDRARGRVCSPEHARELLDGLASVWAGLGSDEQVVIGHVLHEHKLAAKREEMREVVTVGDGCSICGICGGRGYVMGNPCAGCNERG